LMLDLVHRNIDNRTLNSESPLAAPASPVILTFLPERNRRDVFMLPGLPCRFLNESFTPSPSFNFCPGERGSLISSLGVLSMTFCPCGIATDLNFPPLAAFPVFPQRAICLESPPSFHDLSSFLPPFSRTREQRQLPRCTDQFFLSIFWRPPVSGCISSLVIQVIGRCPHPPPYL